MSDRRLHAARQLPAWLIFDVRRMLAMSDVNHITITPAEPTDSGTVMALLRALSEEHVRHIGALPTRLAAAVDHFLADRQRGFVTLAKVDGESVGLAAVTIISSIHYAGSIAWLEEIYVLPRYRRRGIATDLLSAVVRRAQELRLSVLGLDLNAESENIASLYGRLGFERQPRSTWVKALDDAFEKKA